MKADINLKLIAGNSNPKLSEAIARRMSVYRGMPVELADARVAAFQGR